MAGPGKTQGKARAPAPPAHLRESLTDDQEADLRAAFGLLDAEGSGSISSRALVVALRALGYEPGPSELHGLLAEADRTPTGALSFEDFHRILSDKVLDAHNEAELALAFPLFTAASGDGSRGDGDAPRTIGLEDLRAVGLELGEPVDDEELAEMLREADVLDRDGRVSEAEFLRIMKREAA